ncbi:MAG: hypothetical protein E3J56_01435 [Candidatus Aminicenantes bacterium]|nr:MAG: hypothetical protein E3J56_01435 [Candidatus Aminicenantes bacterium]
MAKLERKLSKGRPKATHGGFSFLVSGRLPAHRVSLQRYLSASRNGLIEDLGGEENLSTQELILIDRSVSILGVLRCIEEFCKERGVFKGDEIQPSLGKHYVSFNNSLKQILALLGLRKHDIDELTPLEYIKQYDAEKAQESGEKTTTQNLSQSEKGAQRASKSDILQGK